MSGEGLRRGDGADYALSTLHDLPLTLVLSTKTRDERVLQELIPTCHALP